MKPLALILALCLGTAAFAGDLTDAARGAKSKRKKSTSKVLTNADVKKSKGKVVDTPNLSPEIKKEPGLIEQYEAKRAAEKAASEARAERERLIAGLEKELAAIEQLYYDENNQPRRDTEIVRKFNDVRAKLDAARAQAQ